ncbi:hypothetical protein [Thalassospira sp. MCCC 1A03138]|uniref:hypothetical protein n=1 Tax=Thalassospira sp. MCCC 1A03138 TaxID=1470576 RepID=UPI000A1F2482|nr:hypothetical protein [Thalassospira sp. MCCC 1A03138]OSQ29919.1 hypothetical protein TH468_14105 [Thalassospira sp. MCCC 1A03138]
MSEKPVYIAVALTVGAIAGIPIGSIVAANFLPIAIGDGWASIGGAFVGVMGTFAVANWSFHRSLIAQEKRLLRPIQKRFEYCDNYLMRIAGLAEKHSKLQRTLFEDIKQIVDAPNLWNPVNIADLARYEAPPALAIKIVIRCNDYPLDEFNEIIRLAKRTSTELTWLREHKREELSPLEIEFIGTLIEEITKLNDAARFCSNVWREMQHIENQGNLLPSLPQLPDAVFRAERQIIRFAASTLLQIKGLRAVH